MSHFTPEPSKRKNQRRMRREILQQKLNREKQKFEKQVNRPYQIFCYPSWLSLELRPVKASMVTYFTVHLKTPLQKEEIQARMLKGFGDLEC